MIWVLLVLPKAEKQFARLDKKYQETAFKALRDLKDDPKRGDILKLSDKRGFRLRAGKVRIIFMITGTLISVIYIGLRSEKTYK